MCAGQMSCIEQGERQDRIHENAIVRRTGKVTRQDYVKLRELHEEGSFLSQCNSQGKDTIFYSDQGKEYSSHLSKVSFVSSKTCSLRTFGRFIGANVNWKANHCPF